MVCPQTSVSGSEFGLICFLMAGTKATNSLRSWFEFSLESHGRRVPDSDCLPGAPLSGGVGGWLNTIEPSAELCASRLLVGADFVGNGVRLLAKITIAKPSAKASILFSWDNIIVG